MGRKAVVVGALLIGAVALAGCSRKDRAPQLLNIKSSQEGPDEFAILPNKPLTLPSDYNALPDPTPGGQNITDATPLADATRALGGNPNAGSNDGTLVAHATRYGVQQNIRGALASEDIEFRRKNDGRVLERLFNVNVYFKAYRKQALDQYSELERMRRAGIRTPSAPPEGIELE